MNPMRINVKTGFTLLELLVALALFAAIVAMLYPTYIGTFRNMDITETYSTRYRMARTAMKRISEDLACACIPDSGESDSDLAGSLVFTGKDDAINSKDADEIEFISDKHLTFTGDTVTGRGRIRYYLKEYEDREGFILFRSDTAELEKAPEDDEDGLMLCEEVNSLNFTFRDEDGDTYDYWDSTSDTFKGKLPVMVSIELEFINDSDPETPIKFTTSVSIPMAKRKYGS